MRVLFGGSFDPVTIGHMHLIRRISALAEHVVVAVMINPGKKAALSREERVAFLKEACRELGNVTVVSHAGLLVECAKQYQADAVVRGVRPLGDFESEFHMAHINKMLSGIETILLTADDEYAYISSSIVREIASFGGDISKMVPPGLAGSIQAALANNKREQTDNREDAGEHFEGKGN